MYDHPLLIQEGVYCESVDLSKCAFLPEPQLANQALVLNDHLHKPALPAYIYAQIKRYEENGKSMRRMDVWCSVVRPEGTGKGCRITIGKFFIEPGWTSLIHAVEQSQVHSAFKKWIGNNFYMMYFRLYARRCNSVGQLLDTPSAVEEIKYTATEFEDEIDPDIWTSACINILKNSAVPPQSTEIHINNPDVENVVVGFIERLTGLYGNIALHWSTLTFRDNDWPLTPRISIFNIRKGWRIGVLSSGTVGGIIDKVTNSKYGVNEICILAETFDLIKRIDESSLVLTPARQEEILEILRIIDFDTALKKMKEPCEVSARHLTGATNDELLALNEGKISIDIPRALSNYTALKTLAEVLSLLNPEETHPQKFNAKIDFSAVELLLWVFGYRGSVDYAVADNGEECDGLLIYDPSIGEHCGVLTSITKTQWLIKKWVF